MTEQRVESETCPCNSEFAEKTKARSLVGRLTDEDDHHTAPLSSLRDPTTASVFPSYGSTRLLSTRPLSASAASLACSKLALDDDFDFSPSNWITQQSDLRPPVNAKARELDFQISDAFLVGEEVFISQDNRKEHSFAQINETFCDAGCLLSWKEFQEMDLRLTVDPRFEHFLAKPQNSLGSNLSASYLLAGYDKELPDEQCVCGSTDMSASCGCFCQSASRLVEILQRQNSSSKLLETSPAADLEDDNASSFHYNQGNTYVASRDEYPSLPTSDCDSFHLNLATPSAYKTGMTSQASLSALTSAFTQKMDYPAHPNISTETRQSVINWMWKVVQSMHWSPATFFIAVHAMDMYLLNSRRCPLDESEVPLISTACLFLGVSTEEEHIQAQKSKHFIGQVPNVVSVRQIFNQQLEILAMLPKDLMTTKTPQDLCFHFLARMRSSAVLTARTMKRGVLGVSTLSTASSSSSKKLQLVTADSIARFYNFAVSTLLSRSLPELLPSPASSITNSQHSVIELIVDCVVFLLVKCFDRGIYTFIPTARLTAAMCLSVFITLVDRLTKGDDSSNSALDHPRVCRDYSSTCQFCSIVFELDYEYQLQPIVSQLPHFFDVIMIEGVPVGLQPLLCYLRQIEFPRSPSTPKIGPKSPSVSMVHSSTRKHDGVRKSRNEEETTRVLSFSDQRRLGTATHHSPSQPSRRP